MQVRVPIIDFDHKIPAQAPGSDAEENFLVARVRIRGADIRHLQRLLERTQLEDAGQALAWSHLAVELNIYFERFGMSVVEPRARHHTEFYRDALSSIVQVTRTRDTGIGIDFGTTNSTLALASGESVRLAHFPFMETVVETFRSVLFFPHGGNRGQKSLAGPQAVEAYLEPHEGGRFIQSLKSFVASSTFQQTVINGRPYLLEELIGLFLRTFRVQAEEQFGPLGKRIVAGRPVRFVGAEKPEDEDRALRRLRRSFAIAGFDEVEFEYEPIGAAHAYAQRLQQPELVLIADFGGGTSDFSLVHLGKQGATSEIIGTSGVGVGGDTFDARIIRRLVSPMLGLGSTYVSVDKVLPVPSSLYFKLESWHHLSFLRSRENIRLIESLRAQSEDAEPFDRLLEIVHEDLGYHLHRAVQRVKVDLSIHEEARFMFNDASLHIDKKVKRAQFETWIAGELDQIRGALAELLNATGAAVAKIDRVFLTGGSSLVPAVRAIFAADFGEQKLAGGDEFTSVARGLALRACHSD